MRIFAFVLLLASICCATVWDDITNPDVGITVSNKFETWRSFAGLTIKRSRGSWLLSQQGDVEFVDVPVKSRAKLKFLSRRIIPTVNIAALPLADIPSDLGSHNFNILVHVPGTNFVVNGTNYVWRMK